MAAQRRIELALDQNFPEPILACLQDFLIDIRLVPLREIHPGFPELDDRPLLIALHQLGWLGLVTNNYKMLRNPKELAAVLKAKVSIFAIQGAGHDPIRATGALLLDLPGALRKMGEIPGSVFWLRPRNPQPQSAWDLFKGAAGRENRESGELFAEVKVSDSELETPVVEGGRRPEEIR